MHRPQSATDRQETEMATKSFHELQAVGTDGDPVQRLRLLCLSRGTDGILGMGRMFRRMDDDGNKPLHLDAFMRGLRELGMEVTHEEGVALFHKFDEHYSGNIDMTAFLIHIRPPMSETRTKDVESAFNKVDKTSDGVITLHDLKRGYNVRANTRYISGEDTKEEIQNRFIAHFAKDATKGGTVTHEEFFNYYSAISASIDNDGYFDLMMRQDYRL